MNEIEFECIKNSISCIQTADSLQMICLINLVENHSFWSKLSLGDMFHLCVILTMNKHLAGSMIPKVAGVSFNINETHWFSFIGMLIIDKLCIAIEHREKISLTKWHRYWVVVGIRFKAVSSSNLSAEDFIGLAILDMEKLQHIMSTLTCSSHDSSSEEEKLALQDARKLIMLRMARAISDQEKTRHVCSENVMRKFVRELFPDDSVYEVEVSEEINGFIKLNSSRQESLSWPEWINNSGIAVLKAMLLVMFAFFWFSEDINVQGKIALTFSLCISKIGVLVLERHSEKVFRSGHLSEAEGINIRQGTGVW